MIDLHQVAKIFSVLSTERRCKIVRLLIDAQRPIASSVIATVTGETEATTSFNLTALREAKIVTAIRTGRWALYLIDPEVIGVIAEFFTVQETDLV